MTLIQTLEKHWPDDSPYFIEHNGIRWFQWRSNGEQQPIVRMDNHQERIAAALAASYFRAICNANIKNAGTDGKSHVYWNAYYAERAFQNLYQGDEAND